MASTFRVATLETAFTADTSGIDAAVRAVRGETDTLDGQVTEAEIVADATDALRQIDDIRGELEDVAREDTEAVVTADVTDAERAISDVEGELDGIRDEDVEVDIDVDADGARDGLRSAERGLDDFRDESSQIARESATSFSGEFEDVSDVIRDLAANAFSGWGAAGAVAGVAVAAGIGIAVTKLQEIADGVNDAREELYDLSTEIAGVDGDLEQVDFAARMQEWAGEIVDTRSAWELWQEDAVTNLDVVRAAAQVTGEDVVDFLAAMAGGDVDAAAAQLEEYTERAAELDKEILEAEDALYKYTGTVDENGNIVEDNTGALADNLDALREERSGLDDLIDPLQENVTEMQRAQEEADLLAAASHGLTLEQYELKKQVDQTNDALEESGDAARTAAGAELDLEDQLKDTRDAMDKKKRVTNDEERALLDLADQIADTAQAQEDSTRKTGSAEDATRDYNKVIDRNREEFIKAARAAGHTAKEAEALADEYGLIPKKVNTDINGDARDAKREGRDARRYLNNLHANIKVSAHTGNAYAEARAVQRYINGLNATLRIQGRRPAAGPNSVGGGPTFADGGFYEDHTAQIAAPGEWRVWAEPETGGEAYIPLSPAKRGRSMDILAEVADRFGATLTKHANGSVSSGGGVPAVQSLAPVGAYFTDRQVERLADAFERGAGRAHAFATAAQDQRSRYVTGVR